MMYYAHFGHREFILCLGYMGESIKQYFINYAEWISMISALGPGNEIHLFNRDIAGGKSPSRGHWT